MGGQVGEWTGRWVGRWVGEQVDGSTESWENRKVGGQIGE